MALKGIKVLELAGLAPVPFCGMVLADFGAEVLRIDKLESNTDLDCLGNGKKSIALDLKHPEGVEIMKKLSRRSDVILEPFRAGVMESLGVGPDVLLKENPKLIYARLTGYGQEGPMCRKAGHDINYLALSGVQSTFGRFGEKPSIPVNLCGDFGGGGLICALGIILALYERNSSGRGQVVDSSIVEGTAYLASWLFRSQILPLWGNPRGKNVLDGGVHFYEVYETKDGKYMSVGAIEHKFYEDFVKGLGLDELPQFGDFDELKAIVANKFLEKNQDEWCEIFEKLDACVEPILSLEEAPRFPHNVYQNSFSDDNFSSPNPAPKLSRTPGVTQCKKPLPKIGEHTEIILSQLGYDQTAISKLLEEEAIGIYRNSKL